ncbi:hypothetical protein CRN67_08895 [Campylobacter blaseri]|uniref:ABC transmembrane type-1 domain-containing protein n=1 Tax=Campylobacter blaseri TaxID=2042961 RepID=A0A2P8QYL0_9BACT|nr:hypothetical protein CQ405_08890 [Campylobacter blaseri]PSM52489.1 hypothetical protein CRN67_08895 [Campylobacter blaseri]
MVIKFTKRPNWSLLLSFFILFLITIPIFYIVIHIFNDIKPTTKTLFDTYLMIYIKNSFIIVFFTAIFTTIIGVFLAYFETFYEYKFRNFFRFTLILPFAFPSYLFGYIYTDFFSYSGWFITWLRVNYDIRLHFDIMNIYGCIFILTIAFFPYVYILLRGFLSKFSLNLIESAQSLGKSDLYIFFKVVLPLSRAAIVAGTSLCIMECLNAYGVPNYFGLHVFSTGIYKAWVGYQDLNAAIKLAGILLSIVFSLMILEKIFRKPYSMTTTKNRVFSRKKLSKKNEIIVLTLFFTILFVSLILPTIHLFVWISRTFNYIDWGNLILISKNTILLTIISTVMIILISLFLNETIRFKKGKTKEMFSTLANMGYSIPGSVIAIGMLILFISIDHFLGNFYKNLGIDKNLVLTLSPIILMFSYCIRFLCLGYNGIEAGLKRVNPSYHESSLSLGKGKFQTFLKVDLPMIQTSIYSAFILIFIEIIKELPLASLLSPPNFKTLAFEMDRYASDEQLAMTSVPAFVVVVICLVLLIVFNVIQKKAKK